MSIVCEFQDLQPAPAVTIRLRTPAAELPSALGRCFRETFQHITSQGRQPAGPPFVAYFNMDMQDLEIEVGYPVAEALEAAGEIRPSSLPGGRAAVCLYTGPYQEMMPAYEALQALVDEHGAQANGITYEHYLNDPAETPPAQLQTRIVFPLA